MKVPVRKSSMFKKGRRSNKGRKFLANKTSGSGKIQQKKRHNK